MDPKLYSVFLECDIDDPEGDYGRQKRQASSSEAIVIEAATFSTITKL